MKSLPIAVTSVTFMSIMLVILLFPSNPNPTSASMNYAVVVLGKLKVIFPRLLSEPCMITGGTLVLSILYYYLPKYGGAVWFKGPVRTVAVELEEVKTQDRSFSGKDV